MDSKSFVQQLVASNEKKLSEIGNLQVSAEQTINPAQALPGLLRVALANEISVSELAAIWMPSAADWDFKITLAQQAGDEARHFRLIQKRLAELGLALSDFNPPPVNPLFEYLRGLKTAVEKIAAGQVVLEAIAYRVNDNFLKFCEELGDAATAEIYRKYIQPDELHHHEMGLRLLEKYAQTADEQQLAVLAAEKTLILAQTLRANAANKMGLACLPGC